MRCARSREKRIFVSLLFASNFLLPIKAKLIERILNYIHCVSLPTIFHFASFRFVFASFHIRFASDAKTSEKTLFSHRSEKISLPFHYISLRSKNDGSFLLQFRVISVLSKNDSSFLLLFRFILLQSENYGSFCFRFASFRFEAKMMAVFRFFLVLFLLHSIFVSLQISMFCTNAKQAK
jgi:hypothetical protein